MKMLAWIKKHLAPLVVWIVWAIVVVVTMVMVVVGVGFASDVKNCQQQLITAINARSQLAVQQNDLNVAQSDAESAWIGALLQPPPDIVILPQDNPERRAWSIRITDDYSRTLIDIKARRAANDKQRSDNPLPEPNCGK
jgi:hypothetical protein